MAKTKKTPNELKPLEDQIILLELVCRSLEVLTGDAITDKGIDLDEVKRLIKKKSSIDNALYAGDKSSTLDKIQEKAYSLKKELAKFKTDLEVDFTNKVKSIQDPAGRFAPKTASIKQVIKKHLSN